MRALLLCREKQSLCVLSSALDELGIEQEVCLAASEATQRMVQAPYSALVLDFDLPGVQQVARFARLAPPQRRPVIFAMIGASTEIGDTFQAGANFVLYKPLAFDQVMRSLRAGRGFMQPDRRRSQRQKLEALVYLQFGIVSLPALVLDVNEHGLSLQAPEPLPPVQHVPWRFVLPGTTHMLEGTGELIWADDEGRAGMLFSKVSSASMKQLKLWINKRHRVKRHPIRAPRQAEKAGQAAHLVH